MELERISFIGYTPYSQWIIRIPQLKSLQGWPNFRRGRLNYEPFIRRFLVSQHIAFYRTPDLLRLPITYYHIFKRAGSSLFWTNFTCIFLLLRWLFSRLYRASYLSVLRPISMSESQGLEYQHLLYSWDFTNLIKSTVKQSSFCSANLFPFLECFVSEQFAHPFSAVPVPRWSSW